MHKRPLLLMSVIFAIGIYVGMQKINIFSAVLICTALFLAVLLCTEKKKSLCIGVAIFFFAGMARIGMAELHYDKISARYDGKVINTEMTIIDFSENGRAVAKFSADSHRYKAYLKVKENIQLYPGDIVSGEISLKEPLSSKVLSSDFSTYLRSRDVPLSAYAEKVSVTGRKTSGFDGMVYSLRVYMDKVGEKYFSDDTRALFNAMVFGDKRLLSGELSDALEASGLNHIAVVSGMHISIIILLQSAFFHLILGRRRLVGILVVAGALLTTVLTGAGASIMRAFVMSVVFQCARVFHRENDSLTNLSFSALALLALNPYYLFNAGFVLSVLSVLGLILYSEKLTKAFDWIFPKSVCATMGTTCGAQLGVTGAVVMYFGVITPYALLSNLLILSVATAFSVAGMAFFILCKVPLLSFFTQGLIQIMSDICRAICFGVSSVPGALVETGKATPFFMAGWIVIMVFIYRFPIKKYAVEKLVLTFVSVLTILNICIREPVAEIKFFTYGSKNMSVISLADNNMIMIDCPNFYDAKNICDEMGKQVSCLILSTPPQAETTNFVEKCRPKSVIIPGALMSDKKTAEFVEKAKKSSAYVAVLEDGKGIGPSGVWVRYIPFENASSRGVEILCKGKRFVSLQGFETKEIVGLCKEKIRIECDLLKIPFGTFPENTKIENLTDGKIILTEKSAEIS